MLLTDVVPTLDTYASYLDGHVIGIGTAQMIGNLLKCSLPREHLAFLKTAFGRHIDHRVETPATRTTKY